MAKFDIREFNYITCGKSQNTFNFAFSYTDDGMIRTSRKPASLSVVETKTFFGDIGEYDSMSQRFASNKSSFYDVTNKVIVHNLYDITKTQLKCTSKKRTEALSSNENIDIYVPAISSDFIGIAQMQNYAYGLTKITSEDPVVINVEMNDKTNNDTTYHYKLSSSNAQSFLSPPACSVLHHRQEADHQMFTSYDDLISAYSELSNGILSTIFKANKNLDGVQKNIVVEIPEYRSYNDYTLGYIKADQFVAKNHLDTSYTMHIDTSLDLSAAREYCNIGACAGLLYLTYRDNVNYVCGSDCTTNDDSPSDEFFSNIMQQYSMSKVKHPYTYQHIEVIDSVSKWDGSSGNGHKSSMFSLRLVDTGLNDSTINENVKMKLRQNIKNNVKSIIQSLIPAHTQLFDIYFDGR